MNVLVLGKFQSPLTPIIRDSDCKVIEYDGLVNSDFLEENNIHFAVSYGYRHIIKKPVIDHLNGKIINLHLSYLPWNRGADPNLWSFLENTPKGVTIHYVDDGLDTGDIISQTEVFFNEQYDTLRTTYEKLSQQMVQLFRDNWPDILIGTVNRKKQPAIGSYHRLKDKEKFNYLLTKQGWNTPVKELIGKAL
jgi:methionyl-tRNA formyltransferase